MDLELIERVRKYALVVESESRFKHSMRTAKTAEYMCAIYGQNPKEGYFAGLAHDICKEMRDQLLFSFVSRDGLPISELEYEKPSLLHGRAAAAMLKSDFGVNNEPLLEAVRFHTFGFPGMGDLAKIVYAADKIEPGRSHVTSEYHKKLFSLPLNHLVLYVVKENMDYLKAKGKVVASVTTQFFSWLETICSEEQL